MIKQTNDKKINKGTSYKFMEYEKNGETYSCYTDFESITVYNKKDEITFVCPNENIHDTHLSSLFYDNHQENLKSIDNLILHIDVLKKQKNKIKLQNTCEKILIVGAFALPFAAGIAIGKDLGFVQGLGAFATATLGEGIVFSVLSDDTDSYHKKTKETNALFKELETKRLQLDEKLCSEIIYSCIKFGDNINIEQLKKLNKKRNILFEKDDFSKTVTNFIRKRQ